ncbi:MAG: carboxypeptidase regulatory-like domain-containing protein [Planctomycetes bacterium]|nr:carboxypeptidase regulatory-like domain-containing protein [Planctomycetota bacterium]
MTRGCLVSFLLVALATGAPLPSPLAAQEPATIALSGRVVDGVGKPVAGAAVAFVPVAKFTTAQLLAEPEVRTGDDGRFVLRAPTLPSGEPTDQPVLQIAARGFAAVQPPIRWQFGKTRAVMPTPGRNEPQPRLDTDVGDIALPDGARLFGRVRDADGKGIADCVVTLRDLFDSQHTLRGPQSNVQCRAVTDRSGIFELPCGLAVGAAVEFAAKGFHRARLPAVAAGAPLEVVLPPGGRIAGRVVDDKGGLVAGASVWATYERRGNTTPVRSDDDGTFELWTEQPGRFRVHARQPTPNDAPRGRTQPPTTQSALQSGPVSNLELVLPIAAPVAATKATATLTVQAFAKGTKEPVPGMRAVSIWQEFALRNEAYLDYLAGVHLRDAAASEDHQATVRGPNEGEGQTGVIVVRAPGFAPTALRDVAWPEVDAIATARPLVVELPREATVTGRVLDERTGEPIAGAKVFAQRRQDPRQGRFGNEDEVPELAVETGADGSYRLDQLAAGDFVLRVLPGKRPRPGPVEFTLAAEEQKQGLDVKLAAGARVAGRLTGLDLPAGSKVFLHPIPAPRLTANSIYSNAGSSVPKERTDVASDGTFAIDGVALAAYFLVLELPRPPRGGGSLFVPIEPLRVRAEGIARDFDLGVDRPGRIRGTLRHPRAVPEGQVPVVVAIPIDDQNGHNVFYSQFQHDGPRALVAVGGRFELPVGSGPHRLCVVDAATGVLLASPQQRLEVGPNGELVHELAVALTEVTVTLTPPADAGPFVWIDRLEIRHQPPQPNAGNVVFGNDDYDRGSGVPVAPGQTTVRLWLPAGKVTLLARGSSSQLAVGRNQRGDQAPLGRAEFELAADEKAAKLVTIEVSAPPPIDAAEATPVDATKPR